MDGTAGRRGNEGDEEEHEHEKHAHSHSDGAPYRRTDLKGYLQVRYEPSEQLALSATWKPYYVTANQGEDEKKGLKNEMHFGAIYAFGDGDVNFCSFRATIMVPSAGSQSATSICQAKLML